MAGSSVEVPCLVCAKCGNPAATKSSLMPGKAETSVNTVYAYELHVLDGSCWCYSATSQGASTQRYDLIRTNVKTMEVNNLKNAFQPLLTVVSSAGPDFPAGAFFSNPSISQREGLHREMQSDWFPGFFGKAIFCLQCRPSQLLGWEYSREKRDNPTFAALILTRLRERPVDPNRTDLISTLDFDAVRRVLQMHAQAQASREEDGNNSLMDHAHSAVSASTIRRRIAATEELPIRGAMTPGQAMILAMREPRRHASFASMEARRVRALQEAEEPSLPPQFGRTGARRRSGASSSASTVIGTHPAQEDSLPNPSLVRRRSSNPEQRDPLSNRNTSRSACTTCGLENFNCQCSSSQQMNGTVAALHISAPRQRRSPETRLEGALRRIG